MNTLAELVDSYEPANGPSEATMMTKEAIQEIILYAINKAGFSDSIVFHGGTCLRILHGLDRFSEDLDFNLSGMDPDFDTDDLIMAISKELEATGLDNYTKVRPGKGVKPIFSVKFNTNLKNAIRTAGFDQEIVKIIHP